ncbi:purine-nucleoside phosphorylase [Bythopirellula polymerisocia]|uniref:Purine nucleoside phosphorylase n=1 Tax=Bythopirellula polymerisocia TaxID=2528003 RepID=A0A5C6CMG5_9BACT|nr:purine-nucleoside phosphorylase [Bythopirellula polymerisocia]TWU25598.1 Purine nucleoside phosphorylase 1 [Bythopirellula polymerisocia]
MQEVANQSAAAAAAVRERWDSTPSVGIILGSGLGGLADKIVVEQTFDYAEIPHFPRTTALGHKGRLICGRLADVPVVAFQGRFHLYEGYTAQQAAQPARLSRALGADTLIVSNAAGGVNPRYAVGDVMVIDDQINFLFDNPLIGVNDDKLGPRFPDMSSPYDRDLMEIAAEAARRNNFVLHRGVYLAMLGPTYETRAEYRLARHLGADAVGMSTVPEVIAARHADMRVLGLSTITNVGSPDAPSGTSGHDVINAAQSATHKLTEIVQSVVASLK